MKTYQKDKLYIYIYIYYKFQIFIVCLNDYLLQFILMPLLNIHVYIIGLVKQIMILLTKNVTRTGSKTSD
jgi:hypothetical protein